MIKVQALLIREIAGFFHDYLDIFRTSILCALTTVCATFPHHPEKHLRAELIVKASETMASSNDISTAHHTK